MLKNCCFDKRVWIGLGVLAAVLLLADPRLGWAALPVLAGLACPVSMLFMMRGMRRNAASSAPAPGGQSAGRDRAAEIARLRREIDLLKGQLSQPDGADAPAGHAAPPAGDGFPPGGQADPPGGQADPPGGQTAPRGGVGRRIPG